MPKNFQSPAIRTTTRIFPFLKIKIFSPSLFSLAPLSPPNLHSHCLASSPELPDITNSKKIGLCLVKKPQNYLSFSLLPTPKPKDFLPFPTSDIAKKFSSLFLFIYLYFFTSFFFLTENRYIFLWRWIWQHNLSYFYNQILPKMVLFCYGMRTSDVARFVWWWIWLFKSVIGVRFGCFYLGKRRI